MTTTTSIDDVTASDVVVGLDPMGHDGPTVSWAVDAARSSGDRLVLLRAVDLGARRSWIVEGMLGERTLHLFRPAVRREVQRARREAGPGIEVLVPPIPSAPDLALSDTERVVVAVGGATGAGAIAYAFETAHHRHLPLVLLHADGQDSGDAALDNRVHLHEVIDAQRSIHPDVQTIPVTVPGDVATATRENVGPHDLLVVGNREVDLPTAPVVDRVLLPLLRHPRQVLVVVPDPHETTGPGDPLLARPAPGDVVRTRR